MNNLTIKQINIGGQKVPVTDSREVATMTGKEHSNLMRDIRGYVSILENSKLNSQNFFVKDTYRVEGNNKTYDCFLLTKKGCDMVANKMTGEKGILFTAEYVTRFEEMEKALTVTKLDSYMIEDPIKRAEAWIKEQQEKSVLKLENAQLVQQNGELKAKADYTDVILKNKGLVTITQIAKDYGLSGQALNDKLHELKVQYKIGDQWLLYSKYHAKGYTHSETIPITRKNGMKDVNMLTKWTQKGRLFIYELLKENNIFPLIEKED